VSKSLDISNAIINVVQKIRQGEIAQVDQAVIDSIADLDHYVESAVWAKLRQDNSAVVRGIQDAQMSSAAAALQLGLPGLEHAALPSAVRDLEAPADKPRMKSVRRATPKEIQTEIKTYRRRVDAQSRIVNGYEVTWSKIEELVDLHDEMTGEDIEQALRAIGS
jgi:hypothetical protein